MVTVRTLTGTKFIFVRDEKKMNGLSFHLCYDPDVPHSENNPVFCTETTNNKERRNLQKTKRRVTRRTVCSRNDHLQNKNGKWVMGGTWLNVSVNFVTILKYIGDATSMKSSIFNIGGASTYFPLHIDSDQLCSISNISYDSSKVWYVLYSTSTSHF